MSSFAILTDTTSDLGPEMLEQLGVTAVPLGFTFGEESYEHYADEREMSFRDFYARIRNGEMAKTTAISPATWMSYLRPELEAGRDVLILAFSSGLSTTYSSGVMAAVELKEEFPERRVEVVDTLSASLGEGLLVWHTCQRRNEGMDIIQTRDWANNNKLKLCHWFTVFDLNHLHRGGRVSAATAIIGSVIGIKPVLHVDDAGHLINVDKARGRKNSLKALLNSMEKTVVEPENQIAFLSHGDCEDEAKEFAEEIKRRFKVRDVYINPVGPVVGAHCGIGTMALFFMGTHR